MQPISTKLAMAAAIAGTQLTNTELTNLNEAERVVDTNAYRKSRKERARMLTKQRMEELAKCPRDGKRRRRNKK